MFRKIFSKILGYCVPQLKPILNKEFNVEGFKNIVINTELEEITKLYEPYRIIKSQIGKGTYISLNSKISYTQIGKFCSIGPNFVCGWGIHPIDGISTSPYFYSTQKQNSETVADKNLIEERKKINIGNDVFIGANVVVLDGVSIGDGAIIGAGSVVSKDIPDFAVAYGNPIEIRKYRFTEHQRKKIKDMEWWNFNPDQLKEIHKLFFQVDEFINNYKS